MSYFIDNLLSLLVASIIILLFILIKKRLEYFSSRGIPYIKPTFLDIMKSLSMNHVINRQLEVYESEQEKGKPCIGIFQTFLAPSILILDPAMVENILIKDFSHFHDHGIQIDSKIEPLAGHLFNMAGDEWRTLRNKLLPTFTSGKLKGMVPIMHDCSRTLISSMNQNNKMLEDVNLKELFQNYSLSVIASCVFAIDAESVKNPNCEFRKILNTVLKPSLLSIIKSTLVLMVPRFAKLFRIKIFPQYVNDFFINLTKEALEARKSTGMKRNDFIQLLLELKEKGSVQVDVRDLEEDEKKNVQQAAESEPSSNKLEITDELLAAQSFVFIVAGFDNTAFLAAITAYLLSKHNDIQQRVREEIRNAISIHGGMNYLALKDMKLLDGSINEGLRIYPAAVILPRKCNKNYIINEIKIEKDMSILIPTTALQKDRKYWPDPERFNPDRFLNIDIKPGTFLPFGDGPRICIAQRFALLMVKILLAELLINFKVQPSSKTKEPLKRNFLTGADMEGGLWSCFEPLQQQAATK